MADTIGSGGSYDFDNFPSWRADIGSDPVAAREGICMEDEAVATTFQNWLNANGNAVELKLSSDPTVRHSYTGTTGARIASTSFYGMRIGTSDVVLDGMIVTTNQNQSALQILGANCTRIAINNCYISATHATATTNEAIVIHTMPSGGTLTITGTATVQESGNTVVAFEVLTGANGAVITCTNCSVLQTGASVAAAGNVINDVSTATITFYNSKVLGPSVNGTTRLSFDSSILGDYNVSSDTSAAGANSIHSETAANHYVSATAGSVDMKINAGLDKSAFWGTNDLAGTFDATGAERIGDRCDMGCNQQSVAASGDGAAAARRNDDAYYYGLV